MRWLRFEFVVLGCIAAGACNPDENVNFFQDISRDPGYPGAAGDPTAYQNLFAYKPDPDCAPRVPRKLKGTTEVRVFRGNGISDEDVFRFLGGLKRYYDYYGVNMFTRHDVLPVALDHAVVFNEGAILDKMRALGVNPSCSDSASPSTACQRAIGAAMFYNVKGFLRLYAEPKEDLINIVLLKRIAALNPSPSSADSWGIAGLGLSEELVNSPGASDLGTSLADVLDEPSFSPTVFIGVNLVDFLIPEPDTVIAHEFGHAYGLEHINDPTNLMNPKADNCAQSLSTSQLATIEKETVRSGNLLFGNRYEPRDFLSFTHRAPEIMGILRSRIAERARQTGNTP